MANIKENTIFGDEYGTDLLKQMLTVLCGGKGAQIDRVIIND